MPAAVRALIDVNVVSGNLHLIYRDPQITVYGASHSLLAPTPAQVNDQRAGSASDGC